MGLIVTLDIPGRPVPKERPRFVKGRPYTAARTVEAEKRIAEHLKVRYPSLRPVAGPVAIALTFWTGGGPVADWDNLSKLVCDAFNGKCWGDDRQIAYATVRCYTRNRTSTGAPSTHIEVYTLEAGSAWRAGEDDVQ